MGLDISAYSRLTPGAASEPNAWHAYPGPGRSEGIAPGIYTFEAMISFRAGSYSGYNWWRDHLARMAGYESAESVWKESKTGPFTELINFSDCEGIIGPVVAAKLYKDFVEHEETAKQYAAKVVGWFDNYRFWMKAFELAADSGAVEFH